MHKFDVGTQKKIHRAAVAPGIGQSHRTDLKARDRDYGIGFCQRKQAYHELFQIDFQALDQLGALPGNKPAGLPGYALQDALSGLWKFKQLLLELFLALVYHPLNSSILLAEILA